MVTWESGDPQTHQLLGAGGYSATVGSLAQFAGLQALESAEVALGTTTVSCSTRAFDSTQGPHGSMLQRASTSQFAASACSVLNTVCVEYSTSGLWIAIVSVVLRCSLAQRALLLQFVKGSGDWCIFVVGEVRLAGVLAAGYSSAWACTACFPYAACA